MDSTGDRIGSRPASAMMLASSDGDLALGPSEDGSSTWVSALHRFAVKGLNHDRLEQVNLEPGGGFPYDRNMGYGRFISMPRPIGSRP